VRFAQRVIALRHDYPILRAGVFFVALHNRIWTQDVNVGRSRGQEKTAGKLNDPGEAASHGARRRANRVASVRPGSDATLLLILNAYHDVVVFTCQPCSEATSGSVSSTPTCRTQRRAAVRARRPLPGHWTSLLLFVLQPWRRPKRPETDADRLLPPPPVGLTAAVAAPFRAVLSMTNGPWIMSLAEDTEPCQREALGGTSRSPRKSGKRSMLSCVKPRRASRRCSNLAPSRFRVEKVTMTGSSEMLAHD